MLSLHKKSKPIRKSNVPTRQGLKAKNVVDASKFANARKRALNQMQRNQVSSKRQ